MTSGRENALELLKLIQKATTAALNEYEKAGSEVPSLDSTSPHPLDSSLENLALKKAVRTLEGACEQLCSTLAPPAHTLFNRGQDYYWACLRVAIEGRISDILDPHPEGLHIDEIAKAAKMESKKLSGILTLLATRSCFREVDTEVFANNRLSVLLKSENNFRDFMSMLTLEGPQSAMYLYDNFVDPQKGTSYNPADSPFMWFLEKDTGYKGSFFEWQKTRPDRMKVFGRGMKAMGEVLGSNSSLSNFPWQNYTTICDVGSGFGSFSIPLAKSFPHVKLVLHDLPAIMEQAKQIWGKEYPEIVEQGRVEFVPMNFLEVQPAAGQDVYYLRNIVHNWPDEQTKIILRNVVGAMDNHSRLVIHEYVLQHADRRSNEANQGVGTELAPPPLLPNYGMGNIRMYNQDLVMLLMYNARERTLKQFVDIGREVGLDLIKVYDLAEMSLLEFKLAE